MNRTPAIDIILVAAGRGERIGTPDQGPKQYRLIGQAPIIQHAITRFAAQDWVRKIWVVHHRDDAVLLAQAVGASQIKTTIGGATRQASVLKGLIALQNNPPDYVMIHDAVRPFVTPQALNALMQSLSPKSGVMLAQPVTDSLMLCDGDGLVQKPVERAAMRAAQTPQCFPYQTILSAHQKAATENKSFTDDASLAHYYGLPIQTIDNDASNFKITFAADIARAEAILKGTDMLIPDIRTGNGYDVHATMAGDHVTLCGVKIPAKIALNGHSDADVGMHALTDALLSTIAAGDIGTHFPPSDKQWKGAASSIFLAHAAQLVREAEGTLTHCAITLICEAPKIGPHRAAMTETLAKVLGMPQSRISITATTNEAIGFVGRGEGIAAIATATVAFPPFDPNGISI